MNKEEQKAQKESYKKAIAIYKKDIKFWQSKKKEADTMIAHDRKEIREYQERLRNIGKKWK